MAGGHEQQLMEMIKDLQGILQRLTLTTDPAAREAMIQEARLLLQEIQLIGQRYPHLSNILQMHRAIIENGRQILAAAAAARIVASDWIGIYAAQALRNSQEAFRALSAIRNSANLTFMYRTMTALRAAGDFARANSIRVSLVAGLEAIGITVTAEVTVPALLMIGALSLLCGCGSAPTPAKTKCESIEELQLEYKKYMMKVDCLELKIGGLQLGPTLPHLDFMQYVLRHHPYYLEIQKTQVIHLKW
jgi:hypothetical protein